MNNNMCSIGNPGNHNSGTVLFLYDSDTLCGNTNYVSIHTNGTISSTSTSEIKRNILDKYNEMP